MLKTPRLLLLAAGMTGVASAATWSGSGTSNWSDSANWDSVPSGTVALTFAGTAGLNNANDISGITATGITFNSGSGAFVIAGNALTLGGDIVNNATSLETLNNALALSAGRSVNAASGDIALGGAITGAFTLTKTGSGKLTLSGTGGTNQLAVNAGTVQLSGGAWTSASPTALTLAVGGATGTNGTLNITGGTHAFGGDNFGNAVRIGAGGGTGVVTVSGGSVMIGSASDAAGNGASINLASYNNSTTNAGTLTVTGGSLSTYGGRLLMGANGATQTATLNLSGTGAITLGVNGTDSDRGSFRIGSGVNTVNLDGGTLSILRFDTTAADGIRSNVYFNGVTVKALGATSDFILGNSVAVTGVGANFQIKNGGLTFDTNGFDITIADSIRQVSGQVGALTKAGAGTLTLSAAMGFTGGVTLNAGTLKFGGSDTFGDASSNPAGAITAAAGTTITNGNTFTTIGTLNLNGATLTTAGGASSAYQAFKLRNTVNVTGASVIGTTGAANSQIHLGASTAGSQTTFNVIGGSDTLTVSAILRDGVTGQTGTVVKAGLIKTGAGQMTLSAANTYTGDTVISAGGITVTSAGALLFKVADAGVGNSVSGTGTLVYDGVMNLDVAGVTTAGSWTLISASTLNESYGSNFTVKFSGGSTFTKNGNLWTNGDFTFDQTTGLLVSAVPEPSAYGLAGAGALGVVALVRRRRRVKAL